MLAEERRREIARLLYRSGAVRTMDLARAFDVSDQTIRRDLHDLEDLGILHKTHGGGVLTGYRGVDYDKRAAQRPSAKAAIARRAAALVRPGMTVVLSPGTTTAAIARALDGRAVEIVTNSLSVAECITSPDTAVVLTGGRLRTRAKALVGERAERSLDDVFGDLGFIGVSGVAMGEGYSVTDAEEASMLRRFIRIAKRAVVVTDAAKFYRSAREIIAPIGMVHGLITDASLAEEHERALIEAGVEVDKAPFEEGVTP